MRIKSFLKKASLALGNILFSLNIGCNSLNSFQNTDVNERQSLEQITEQEILEHERPLGLKAWQYPINFIGGYFISALEHESNHVLAATLYGTKIDRIEIPYADIEGNTYVCAVIYDKETCPEPGSTAKTMMSLAGPLGHRMFVEAINYNLRNGNISEKHQPFWATTSLITRYIIIDIVVGALEEKTQNDFNTVSENTGVSPEAIMGIVLLDLALNYKRIAKEFRVAIGRNYYDTKQEKKGRVDVLPFPNAIGLCYTLDF